MNGRRPLYLSDDLSPEIRQDLPSWLDHRSENPQDHRIVRGRYNVLYRFHNVRFQPSQLFLEIDSQSPDCP